MVVPGFKHNQRRIRCHGHIIKISAQAFLFLIDEEADDAALANGLDIDESAISASMSSKDCRAWGSPSTE
jgi:hypothetical protein